MLLYTGHRTIFVYHINNYKQDVFTMFTERREIVLWGSGRGAWA